MDPSAIDPEAAMKTAGAIAGIVNIVIGVCSIFVVICFWKIFSKAGKPGIAAIVPVWNILVLLEIAGKPAWWIVMILLVPVANIIFGIMAFMGLTQNFGKGGGLGVGLYFLPIIFAPILAFGSAEYQPIVAD